MQKLNERKFTNFSELENINIVEISETTAICGGIRLNSSDEDYHVRWDLAIKGGEYIAHTNLANCFYQYNEIIEQTSIITIMEVVEVHQTHYLENKGWGNYEERENKKIVIIYHPDGDKINANTAFREMWYDYPSIEDVLYWRREEIEEFKIESIKEIEEIEIEDIQICEECLHPLGHLFKDQCPCNFQQ